jgi:hypothetical protein
LRGSFSIFTSSIKNATDYELPDYEVNNSLGLDEVTRRIAQRKELSSNSLQFLNAVVGGSVGKPTVISLIRTLSLVNTA